MSALQRTFTWTPAEDDDSALALKYFLLNTTPHDLYENMRFTLEKRKNKPETIYSLYKSLRDMAVIPGHLMEVVRSTAENHCTRCHLPYLERNNHLVACCVGLPSTAACDWSKLPGRTHDGFDPQGRRCKMNISRHSSASQHRSLLPTTSKCSVCVDGCDSPSATGELNTNFKTETPRRISRIQSQAHLKRS